MATHAQPSKLVEKEQYAADRVRVLIADDSRMSCELLKNALKRSRYHFDVIACAVSRSEILQFLNSAVVDVIVLNENLQDGLFTGFRILSELRATHPKTPVVFLLRSPSREFVIDAFRAGTAGIFCRSEPVEALCKCVRAVHAGQIWAKSSELRLLLEAFVDAVPLRVVNASGRDLLTKRENDVVSLVSEGHSNREVAKKLGLSEHTVSNYLFHVYEKLGISTRVELVLYALNQKSKG